MSKRWWLPLVVLWCAVAASCTEPQVEEPNNPPQAKPAAMLRVEPFDLFQGDAKKFQPFLGDMAGAVRWRYNGEKPTLSVEAEIWENGTKTKSLGSMGITRAPDEQGKPWQGELIISLKDWSSIDPSAAGAETPKYLATVSCYFDEKGSSTHTFLVQAPSRQQIRTSLQLREPVEVADEETIAVWGMQATDENSMTSIDHSPESPVQAKWAIVFRITAADE